MASFDLWSLNPKLRGGADYGFLVDRVKEKENRLKGDDGILSPGDIDNLIPDLQTLYTNPLLSKDQKSNILVDISRLEAQKNITKINFSKDVERLDRDIENDMNKTMYTLGNDPYAFIDSKLTTLEGKMFQLQDTIRTLNRSGGNSPESPDTTFLVLELDKTNKEWIDMKNAMDVVQNYQPGQPPSNFYYNIEINPNREGKKFSVTFGKPEKGMAATNGILSGLHLAGVPIMDIGTKKTKVEVGNMVFSTTDRLTPGTDGYFDPSKILMAEPMQEPLGSRGRTKAVSGFFEVYSSDLTTQKNTVPGSWIKRRDGSFYKDIGNGQYERYIGATKEQLQIDDRSLWSNIPDEIFADIKKRTIRTIDATPSFDIPQSMMPSGPVPAAPVGQPPYMTPIPPGGISRTPSPIATSPVTAPDIAQKTTESARGFLSKLFGKFGK